MKKKKDSENETPLFDIDLKEMVLILVSVVVGALLSLYIKTKYGAAIIQNFLEIEAGTIFDILGTAVMYLFFIGIFIAFAAFIAVVIYYIFKVYFEPVKKAYEGLKKKFSLLQKIAEGFEWDPESAYKKKPSLFKLGIFIIINVAIIWKFYLWLLYYWVVFIILGVYVLIGIVYFIIKACKNR